jgi:hypothetical protein
MTGAAGNMGETRKKIAINCQSVSTDLLLNLEIVKFLPFITQGKVMGKSKG